VSVCIVTVCVYLPEGTGCLTVCSVAVSVTIFCVAVIVALCSAAGSVQLSESAGFFFFRGR
jgi:hypothetical protein